MQTALELINLELELLMLRLELLELGVQRPQMHLDRARSVLPFRGGKWKVPGWVCSLDSGEHHSYPWTSLWIQIRPHLPAKQRLQSREKWPLKGLEGPCERAP
jgi:hypothetical protein